GASCGESGLLSVTPSSLDFGSVNINTFAERSFTVRNAGSGTLTGTAGASAPFSISAGESFSLAPGASQIVTARFSPTSSACFSGSVDFSSNGGNLSRLITGTGAGSTTVTTVTSSANPALVGQVVTFTATVSASGTPTGTVTFNDGATTLGTATLNNSGQATFATSALAVGSHTITASYGGDAAFLGSTSAPLTQSIDPTQVTSITPDPVDLATAPTTFTITGGGFANLGSGLPVVNFTRSGQLLGQARATVLTGGTSLTVPFPTDQTRLSGPLPGLSAAAAMASLFIQPTPPFPLAATTTLTPTP